MTKNEKIELLKEYEASVQENIFLRKKMRAKQNEKRKMEKKYMLLVDEVEEKAKQMEEKAEQMEEEVERLKKLLAIDILSEVLRKVQSSAFSNVNKKLRGGLKWKKRKK